MTRISIAAVALAFLMPASEAGAFGCLGGCFTQRLACVQSARVTRLACQLDCRASAPDVTACVEGCRATFRSTKADCRTDRLGCVDACRPPVPPPSADCIHSCGVALSGCASGVVTETRACVTGCQTAPDRLTCVQGCAATAIAGAARCAEDFASCLASCAPSSSTTTTTLPLRFCGLDPVQRTCGGECPVGLACLPPPPEAAIIAACLCQLPHAECQQDADCADGNPCTFDRCVFGRCGHLCLCLAPGGSFTCCPGPTATCSPSGAFLE